MAEQPKPTRSELLKLKKQIKLAKSGHNLLKKKRDALIMEFFKILKKARNSRFELAEHYKIAMRKINYARTLESDLKVKSIALAVHKTPDVTFSTRNVMGVVVPSIGAASIHRTLMHRGYGFYGASAVIDEAAEGYQKVLEKIILTAEIETSMKKILNEIEKTKRRVNALEFFLIPTLEKQKSFMQFRLEEIEREGVSRMKWIKAKSESH